MATAGSAVDSGQVTPAYLPFPTFTNFVEKLKANTIPHAIDKSMLGNLSGGVQNHLLGALRFLGLTEGKDNKVTPSLEKLVESFGTEGYQETLKEIILDAYADIVGDLNISKATAKQLEDAFAEQKLEGIVRERAIRFYLKALSESGIAVSPFLGKRRVKVSSNGNGKPRKAKSPTRKAEPTAEHSSSNNRMEIPKGTQHYPLYFKGKPAGSLIVPEDLTPADCSVIELQLAVLKAYAGVEASK